MSSLLPKPKPKPDISQPNNYFSGKRNFSSPLCYVLFLATVLSLILNFYTNPIHPFLNFTPQSFAIHFILPFIPLQSSPPLQFISILSFAIHFNQQFISILCHSFQSSSAISFQSSSAISFQSYCNSQSIHPFLSLPLYNPFIHSSPYLSTLTLSTKYKSLSILTLHKEFDLNIILSRSLSCFFLAHRFLSLVSWNAITGKLFLFLLYPLAKSDCIF